MIGVKIYSSDQMRAMEKEAFEQGASDSAFMDQVASHIADKVQENTYEKVVIVVGKGNNGGDGALVGLLLHQKKIPVVVYHLYEIEEGSDLLQKHLGSLVEAQADVQKITDPKEMVFPEKGIVIDGILGSGFSGQVEGIVRSAIEKINEASCPVFAIDIPSGLNGNTGQASPIAVQATKTFFLKQPKEGFFLEDGFEYVGELVSIDFGLENKFIEKHTSFGSLLTKEDLKELLPDVKRTRHKYDAGLVVGLCTNFSMSGATQLAGLAALRAGSGYVRYLYPKEIENSLHDLPEEFVKISYQSIEEIKQGTEKANCFFVGPGYPTDPKSGSFFKEILSTIDLPYVLDGGALFHLSSDQGSIPKGSILTPHTGEMNRFFPIGKKITKDTLHQCQKFAEDHQVTLVLKGAPTYIFHPGADLYISAFGHPAMATMGTGDVLTGMIAAFVGQGLGGLEASLLAVGLHGIAGQIAAQKLGTYSVIASDLIEQLPKAFLQMDSKS